MPEIKATPEAVKDPAERRGGPSPWWLVSPLLVWSGHFLLIYIITALVCAGRLDLSEAVLAGVNFGLTVLAALGLLALFIRSISGLRHADERSKPLNKAMAVSVVISLVALIWVAAPFFFLGHCA